jgi:hypothetical protein
MIHRERQIGLAARQFRRRTSATSPAKLSSATSVITTSQDLRNGPSIIRISTMHERDLQSDYIAEKVGRCPATSSEPAVRGRCEMRAAIGHIGEDATPAGHSSSDFSSNQFKRFSIYLIATLENSSGATLDDELVFVGIIY